MITSIIPPNGDKSTTDTTPPSGTFYPSDQGHVWDDRGAPCDQETLTGRACFCLLSFVMSWVKNVFSVELKLKSGLMFQLLYKNKKADQCGWTTCAVANTVITLRFQTELVSFWFRVKSSGKVIRLWIDSSASNESVCFFVFFFSELPCCINATWSDLLWNC